MVRWLATRGAAGAATLVAFSLVATGCSAGGPDETGPAPALSPTAGSLPPPELDAEVAAVGEILNMFVSFRELAVEMYAEPDDFGHSERLQEFVAPPLVREILTDLPPMRFDNLARVGAPTWDPEVTEVRLADPVPTATIRDCFDGADWSFVDRGTGEPISAAAYTGGGAFPTGRSVLTFEVRRDDDPSRWRLTDVAVARDEEC